MATTRRFPHRNPQLVYDLAKERLNVQLSQIDSLDTKIGNLLGFGSAILAIVVTILTLAPVMPLYTMILLLMGIAAYGAMVIILLSAYYARRWEAGPDLNEAWQHSIRYEIRTMYWWATESLKKCYFANKNKTALKVKSIKIGLPLLVVETATLTIGLLYSMFLS